MKKLLIGIVALLFIGFISACNNQNKPAENQMDNMSTMQSGDSSTAITSGEDENQMAADNTRRETEENKSRADASGTEIVDNLTKKLTDRLGLSEEQQNKIHELLAKNFIAAGESMEKKYSLENAKELSHNLRQKSLDEIRLLLNDEQKERFENIKRK
jgi:hypothetical protein